MLNLRFFGFIATGFVGVLGSLSLGCVTASSEIKPPERQFYKNPHVRRCLQYDKEQMATESQACWARLQNRIAREPKFVEEAKFIPADLAKIRQMVGEADQNANKLEKELDKCLQVSAANRDERIRCFKDYLERYGNRLSRAEKYEIENSVATLEQARERSLGNVEATIEHAGKLLSAQMHDETEGIRIDQVDNGVLSSAGGRVQGIIVAIDDAPVGDLDSAERVARLERCEDKPVKLMVRNGEIDNITFTTMKVFCGQPRTGQQVGQVVLPPETCSLEKSPEIRLGVSLCYLSREGILEVEEVCADSPAALAGVQPGHRYITINGSRILGMTLGEIGNLLNAYPTNPLVFEEQAGTLESPTAFTQPPLSDTQRDQCWKAIQSILIQEKPAEDK